MTSPTPSTEFAVTVDTADDCTVVRIHGELDMATVPRLHDATRDLVAHGRSVAFDLRGLDFVDSTGLNYFVQLHRAAQADGFGSR